MEVKFLRNHGGNRKGDVVKNHPKAAYLLKMKAVEVIEEKKPKKKKESE